MPNIDVTVIVSADPNDESKTIVTAPDIDMPGKSQANITINFILDEEVKSDGTAITGSPFRFPTSSDGLDHLGITVTRKIGDATADGFEYPVGNPEFQEPTNSGGEISMVDQNDDDAVWHYQLTVLDGGGAPYRTDPRVRNGGKTG